MFSNGENIKSSYFLGILAAFKRFPFSSINPHLLESNFGLNENKFLFENISEFNDYTCGNNQN